MCHKIYLLQFTDCEFVAPQEPKVNKYVVQMKHQVQRYCLLQLKTYSNSVLFDTFLFEILVQEHVLRFFFFFFGIFQNHKLVKTVSEKILGRLAGHGPRRSILSVYIKFPFV